MSETKKNKDLECIVTDWLKQHSFDGLFQADYLNDCDNCACQIGENFMSCGEPKTGCQAGYMQECNCGDHDFHIGEEKQKDKK